VSDGDDEVRPGEDVQLAELHALLGVEVTGGAEDREEQAVVALELGALVCLDGVLDGELVEGELGSDRVQLLRRRAVEPDPAHAVLIAEQFVGDVQGGRLGVAVSVDVDGVLDNSHECGSLQVGARGSEGGVRRRTNRARQSEYAQRRTGATETSNGTRIRAAARRAGDYHHRYSPLPPPRIEFERAGQVGAALSQSGVPGPPSRALGA
jgi:hypothetical protein